MASTADRQRPVPDLSRLPDEIGSDHRDPARGQVEHAGGAVGDENAETGQ